MHGYGLPSLVLAAFPLHHLTALKRIVPRPEGYIFSLVEGDLEIRFSSIANILHVSFRDKMTNSLRTPSLPDGADVLHSPRTLPAPEFLLRIPQLNAPSGDSGVMVWM